jgi:hypothetical protein
MTADEDAEFRRTRATLDAAIAEAVVLRGDTTLPSAESGPDEVLPSLVGVRQSLDRVEALLVTATRIRAIAQRSVEASQAAVDDKWDKRIVETSRSTGEFVGPRERYAHVNLFVVSERRVVRQATERLSVANEAVDVLRIIQRGLDGVRLDHHRLIAGMVFESSLER